MAGRGLFRKVSAAFVAASLLAGSASAAAPRSVDPLVALSVLGTSESYAAICAVGAAQAASAAATAATVQGGAPGGCVLPVVDAAPPPVVTEAPPAPLIAAAPVATAGSLFPLLFGLAAVVVAAVVISHKSSNGEIILPISP